MSKLNLAGGVSWAGAFVLFLFQAISGFTKTGSEFTNIRLLDLAEPKKFEWIKDVSWDVLQNSLNYIITVPLYILLLVVGVFFFVLSGLFNK
ncbi:MAG: hypothetical protein HQK77_14765 [Desulfobacterales bacterium]|nr:hypothetical protein [Desulfobacterales bacterium]